MASTPGAAERRRERRRNEARRAILDASEALLVEGGYEQFSMRRLAARSGYTVPTLYHHFGDKPGLLEELLEERFERLVVQLRRAPRGRDPVGNLLGMARAFVRFGLRHPTHYRLLTTLPLNGAAPPRSAEEARALFEAPLRELADAGRLRTGDVEAALQTIWAFTHGLISLRTSRPDYAWSRDLVVVALDTMIRGLVRPTPEGRRRR